METPPWSTSGWSNWQTQPDFLNSWNDSTTQTPATSARCSLPLWIGPNNRGSKNYHGKSSSNPLGWDLMPWRPQPQPPTTHQVGNLSSLRGRMRFQDRQSLPWNEFSRAKIWESKKTSNRMEFWVWMLYLCFFPMLHCEKGTTFHWRFQLLKSIPLILMKLNISKNCGKKTLDEFYHTLLKTRVEIVTNHPCFLFSAMCLSKIWVRHRYAEGSDPLPHPRIPCESWLSENHHLQHHGSIKHRLTRNLQATTSICVAFHQQFGYPLVKLSNGI